jgi:aspartyl-tRNA(Asn)/glutamyl-tRNA(Gln) amidotransferase subunit B
VLTQGRARADYFEAVLGAVDHEVGAKAAANWVINDLLGALGKSGLDLADSPVAPTALAALLGHLQGGELSTRMAKDALGALLDGADVEAWVAEHGGQVSDGAALVAVIEPILDQNPSQVEQYLGGKDKLFGFVVGKAMKALEGKANPEELQKALRLRHEARRS